MKYCSHCGKKVEENAKFCVHCGEKINGEVKHIPVKTSSVNMNAVKIVCIVCGVFVAFFIAVFLVFVFIFTIAETSLFDEGTDFDSFDYVQPIRERDLEILEHKKDFYSYSLEVYDYNGDGMRSIELENGMEVTINIDDYDYYEPAFKIYLNKKLVFSLREYMFPRTFHFYTLGDYFIFNRNVNSMSEDELIIFDKDGNVVKHFYEMDTKNLGLTVESFSINDSGIKVVASRYADDDLVMDDEFYEFCDIKEKDFKDDYVIKAEYFYSYENGTLDLETPDIEVVETFKDVKNRQKSICR